MKLIVNNKVKGLINELHKKEQMKKKSYKRLREEYKHLKRFYDSLNIYSKRSQAGVITKIKLQKLLKEIYKMEHMIRENKKKSIFVRIYYKIKSILNL